MLFNVVLFSACYVGRAYKHRKFNLKDLDGMASTALAKSGHPFYFETGAVKPALANFLDSNLVDTYTYAFLIIRNDSILYEKYFDQLDSSSLLPSFSVAKSFVGTLVGMALEEGKIKNLDEPVTNYLPYLLKKDRAFSKISIQHVLDMRSGIKSNEDYGNPFSDVLKLGFTKNMKGKLKKLKIETAPGTQDYKSVNTQVLAMIVEAATGKKIQDYLVEKIWQPLGMETSATWNIDSRKHQVARAFCCINATARDFAKLGKLYLNKGNWNGKQLVSANWVNGTVNADTMRKYEGYKNQWWGGDRAEYFKDSLKAVEYAMANNCRRLFSYTTKKDNIKYFGVSCNNTPYYAEGILDQFVFVDPLKNVVIVRLGHYWKHPQTNSENFIYQVDKKL